MITMTDKKCENCGKTNSTSWIEKAGIGGKKGHFCSATCYGEYKRKGEEKGVCEFC